MNRKQNMRYKQILTFDEAEIVPISVNNIDEKCK